MKITIEKIALNNYKGIISFIADLFPQTKISGKNALGKTTVSDAFFDVLTGKLSDGTSTDSIMPHGATGAMVPHVDAKREITLCINGVLHTIGKITRQKWVKPRGETTEHYEGTETLYVIDGFDKKKKEYDEWITANIANQDTLSLCSNAQPFLNTLKKSTAEARKLLEKLAGFDISKVIASKPEYARVNDITKGNALEDTIKQLKKCLREQKKSLETEQSNLVYENSREVPTVNVAELEIEIKAKEKELESITEEEASYQSRIKAVDLKTSESIVLDDRLGKLNAERRRIISAETEALRQIHDDHEYHKGALVRSERAFNELKEHGESLLKQFEELKQKYTAEAATTYNGESTCPVCKQTLPAEMIAKAKDAFETEKKKKLAAIIDAANKKKAEIKENNQAIADKTAELERLKVEISGLEAKLQEREATTRNPRLDEIAAEVESVQSELDNNRKFVDGMSDLNAKKMYWAEQKVALNKAIAEIKVRIEHAGDNAQLKAAAVAKIEENIAREAQRCADIEADIALIEQFSLDKNAVLAEEVNRHFHHFQFVFTETTIDGNINETLKIVVNGTPYQNLNGGDRKLAEIDLVRGLQEMNGLCLPIFSDEANTIDPWRIPETEQQIIVIMRSDDDVIKVESLNG